MTTPLPCPFCGEAPEVQPEVVGARVSCINPRCPTDGVAVHDGIDVCDDRGSDAYKEAAILRWNTRAPIATRITRPSSPVEGEGVPSDPRLP